MAQLIITHNFSDSKSQDYKIYVSTDGTTFNEVDVAFRPFRIEVLTVNNAICIAHDEPSNRGGLHLTFAYYTTDQGSTWQQATGFPNNTSLQIVGLHAVGPNTAYVFLNNSAGIIKTYKTVDGGASYTLINSDTQSFNSVSFIDENIGYSFFSTTAAAGGSKIHKTTDGGVTWNQVSSGQLPFLKTYKGLEVLDENIFYIYGRTSVFSGGPSKIYKTTDGGLTFTETGEITLTKLRVIDSNTLLAVPSRTGGNNLLKSTDSGATWVAKAIPSKELKGLYVKDSLEYYTTITGEIYRTLDGGDSFSPVYTKPVDGMSFGGQFEGVETALGCTNPNSYNYDSSATQDDGSCLFSYKLTDSSNPANVVIADPTLGDDPNPFLGQYIKIDGDTSTCYLVEYSPTNTGAVGVTIDSDFADASSCQLSIPILGCTNPNSYNYNPSATQDDASCLFAYRLTDTKGNQNDIVTLTDLSLQVGLTIKITEVADVCWNVSYESNIAGETTIPVTLDSSFGDAASCELTLPTGYILTDLAGELEDIITNEDLTTLVGQVVKVNGLKACFLVSIHPDNVGAVPVTIYNSFPNDGSCELSLEAVNDFECPEDEEVVVPEPAPVPTPANPLNTYYQTRYSLDQIVREFLIERGEETEHNYPRFLQLAVNGLRELNMDVSGTSKMIVLTIKDDMTVDLPSDYIRYTKIAICSPDGALISLGYNPNMCLPRHVDECGNLIHGRTDAGSFSNQSQNNVSLSGINFNSLSEGLSDNFRNGELTGRFFGMGGGQNSVGYYRVDKERGVIQLSSNVQTTEIVLEYLADISKIDAKYVVHPYLIETVKSYIAWASIRRKAAVNIQEKEIARRDYYNERRISKERFQSFTIDEALSTIRKAFKLSPKM